MSARRRPRTAHGYSSWWKAWTGARAAAAVLLVAVVVIVLLVVT